MRQWYIVFRIRDYLIGCICWLGVSGFLPQNAFAGPDGCIGQPGQVEINIPRIPPGNDAPIIEIVRDGASRYYRTSELPPGVDYQHTASGYRLTVSEAGYYSTTVRFRVFKNYYSYDHQWNTNFSDWYSVNLEESPFITHPLVPYEEGSQPNPSRHPLKEEYVRFLARQKGLPVYHDPELIGCVEYDAGIFLDPETGMALLQQIIDSPEMDGKNLLVLLGGQPGNDAIDVSEPIVIRGQNKSVTIAGLSPAGRQSPDRAQMIFYCLNLQADQDPELKTVATRESWSGSLPKAVPGTAGRFLSAGMMLNARLLIFVLRKTCGAASLRLLLSGGREALDA